MVFSVWAVFERVMTKPGPEVSVDEDEILLRFVLSPDPVFLASEFAEDYDVVRQTVSNWLENLEEKGYVESKKSGGRRFYAITKEGERRVQDRYEQIILDYISDNHQP